jgi:hypothetical protein
MKERIWTRARIRIVVIATLSGVAVTDGMLVMREALSWVGKPQFNSSYQLLTNWAELVALPFSIVGVFFDGGYLYVALGVIGALGGATIGLFISEFTSEKSPPPQF